MTDHLLINICAVVLQVDGVWVDKAYLVQKAKGSRAERSLPGLAWTVTTSFNPLIKLCLCRWMACGLTQHTWSFSVASTHLVA
jgi:hypothetical protein